MKRGGKQDCAYCGEAMATEEDHVIARQFFPALNRFRAGLPKVPSCGRCNRNKQKVEDGPAVFLQLAYASPASLEVAQGRARRTLKKNRRLLKSLQKGFAEVMIRDQGGLFVPRIVIQLSRRELHDLSEWFRLVVKGLFYYHMGFALPGDFTLYLVKPENWLQFVLIRDGILEASNHEKHAIADGEFRYIFTANKSGRLSMWLLSFKSIEVAAVTVGPSMEGDAADDIHARTTLKRQLARIQWT